MSPGTSSAVPPRCRIAATASSPNFSVRAAITTVAPSIAKNSAIVRPIPRPPPTISATFPSNPRIIRSSPRIDPECADTHDVPPPPTGMASHIHERSITDIVSVKPNSAGAWTAPMAGLRHAPAPAAPRRRNPMTGLRYPSLFSPFKLGTVTLRNRTVMAPKSTNLGSDEGEVTPRQIAFYRARAEGGVGMVIVEFCCVHRTTGRSEHRQLSLETPAHLDGHIHLVRAIRSAGAVACLQLQHGGPGVKRELVQHGVAVGPSDIRSRHEADRLTTRALDNDEI